MSQNPFSDTGNVEILIDLKQKGISDAVENLKKLHDSGQLIGKDFEQAIKTVNDLSRALNRLAKDYKEVKSIAGNFDFSNFFSAATKQAAARAEMALSVPANLLSQELARFNPGISPKALERQIKQARSERGALDRLTPGSDFGQQAQLQAQADREARNYELQQRGRRPYQDLYPRSALTTQGNLLPPVSHLPMTGRVLSPAGLGRGGDYLSPQEIEYQRSADILKQKIRYADEQMDQILLQIKTEGQSLKNQVVTGTQKRVGGRVDSSEFASGLARASYVDSISHTRATPQAQVTEAAARRMGIQLSTLGRFSRLASDFDTNPVDFVQAYSRILGQVYLREKRTAGSGEELELLAMSKMVRGWQEPGFPSYGGKTAGNRQESIEGKMRLGRIQIALAQVLEERRQSGFSGMTAADAAGQGEGRLKEFLQFHSVMSGSELRKYAALGGSNPQGRGSGESEILSSRAQLMAQVFSRARVNPTTRARSMYAGELETILGRDPDVHGLLPNDIDAAEAQTRLNEMSTRRNRQRATQQLKQLTQAGGSSTPLSMAELIAQRKKRSNESGFITGEALFGDSFFGLNRENVSGFFSSLFSNSGSAALKTNPRIEQFRQKLDDRLRIAQGRHQDEQETLLQQMQNLPTDPTRRAQTLIRIQERARKSQSRVDALIDAGEFFETGTVGGADAVQLARARVAAGGRTAAGMSTQPQTGGSGRSLSSFGSLYAIGIAEGAAVSATDVFYNATKYAARTQEMELVTRNMAQAAGLSGLAVQQTVQAVQRNFVTAQEAHKTIERLMFSQIDLAKAPALARMAQDVAVIKGVDPSEALDRITQGITSGYTRSLHMMGIMVNSQDIMREEKTKLGRTPNEYERRQAIADKVLSEGVKVSGNFEASLLTASRQSALLGVQAADVMNTVGNQFIPVYSNLLNKVSNIMQSAKTHPALSQVAGAVTGGAGVGLGVLGGGATLGYLLSGLGVQASTIAALGSVAFPLAAVAAIGTGLYLNRDQVGLTAGNIEDRLLSYDRRTSEEAAARQTAASRLGVSISSDIVRFGPVGISRSLAERSQTTSKVLQGGTAELAKRIREASDPSWWQYPSTFFQNLTGVENNAATYLDPNTGLLRPVTGAAVAGYTYAGRRLFPSQFNVGGRVITADAINEQLSQQRQFEALVQIDPTQAYINQYKMIPDQLHRQNEEQLAHQAALTGKKLEMFAERTARQAARGGQAGPLGQMSAEFAERMEEFATTEIPSGVKDEQGHDVMVPTSMMDKMKRTPGYLAAQKAEGQRQSAYATLQRAHLAAKEVQGQQAIGLAQLRLSVLPGDFAGERSLIDSEYTQRIANIQPYLSAFGSTLSAGDRRIQTDHMTAEARMELQKSGATLQESQVQESRRDFTKRQQLAGGVALNELNFSPLGEQQKINEQYKIRMQVAENIGTIASKELQRELELTAAAERTNSRFAVRAAIVAHQFGLESTETIGRLSFDTNRTIGLASIDSPLIREMQSLQNIRTSRSGQLLENQAQFGIDSRNPSIGPDAAGRNLTAANLKTNLGFDQNLFNAEIQSVQSLRSRLAEMYTMRLGFEAKIRDVQNDGATSQVRSLDRNYEQTLALIEKKRLLYGGGAEANLTAAEAQTQASLQYKENVTKIKQQNLADTEDIAGEIFSASRTNRTKSGLSGEGLKIWGQKQLDQLDKQLVSNLAGMVFGDLPSKLGSIIGGQSDPVTGKKTGVGRLLKGTRFEERAEPRDLAKADATLKSAMSTTEQIQKQMEQDLRDILAALTGTSPATSGSAIGNLQNLSSASLVDSTKAFLSLSNGLPQISSGASTFPAASIMSPRLNTTRNGPVMYFSNGSSSSLLSTYNGAGSVNDYMPSVVTSFGGNPNIAGGNGYISVDGTYSDYPSEGAVPISGGGGGGVPGGANPAGMGMGSSTPASVISKSASSLSLFAKGLGKPSQVWEAIGLNNSGTSSDHGLSTPEAIGSMVSAVGVVAAGVHEVTQSLKSAGAKGIFGAAGAAAGTAAALDPEPFSASILAGVALGSKLIASILPDTRADRAKLISDTLGQSAYLAPVAITASMDLNGMATDFDSRGNLRSSNYTTFAQAPTEPYHYQSPINQQWYNIPGYNPGPFQPRQPTGPYPRNPPATPGVPVVGSAGPSVVHQHFNLIDGQGILDRKDEFAEATRQAMINGHQINETMSRLNGRL